MTKIAKTKGRMKTCKKCGQTKPATVEYFGRNKAMPDGLGFYCKECTNALSREWYAANKETRRVTAYSYRDNNPDRVKESRRKWVANNKAKIRAYRKATRTRRLAYLKEWRKTNAAHRKKYARAWQKANRARTRAASLRRRARVLNAEGSYTADDVKAQYERQKGYCYYLRDGKKHKLGKNYHVEHIIPLSRGGTNGPENIVLACAKCNLRKGAKLPSEWPEGGRLL